MPEALTLGSVVRLRSGGPDMTIVERMPGHVRVAWIRGSNIFTATFPPAALLYVGDGEANVEVDVEVEADRDEAQALLTEVAGAITGMVDWMDRARPHIVDHLDRHGYLDDEE